MMGGEITEGCRPNILTKKSFSPHIILKTKGLQESLAICWQKRNCSCKIYPIERMLVEKFLLESMHLVYFVSWIYDPIEITNKETYKLTDQHTSKYFDFEVTIQIRVIESVVFVAKRKFYHSISKYVGQSVCMFVYMFVSTF